MLHHAYVFTHRNEGAKEHLEEYFVQASKKSGERIVQSLYFEYTTLSVEDARDLREQILHLHSSEGRVLCMVSTTTLSTEVQNTLLKVFEEPPPGVILALCVPHSGLLLPTLLSRVQVVRGVGGEGARALCREFVSASATSRKELIARVQKELASDDDEEKAYVRKYVREFFEDLTYFVHERYRSEKKGDDLVLLQELGEFQGVLHMSAPPYKQIFEHLLIVYK